MNKKLLLYVLWFMLNETPPSPCPVGQQLDEQSHADSLNKITTIIELIVKEDEGKKNEVIILVIIWIQIVKNKNNVKYVLC